MQNGQSNSQNTEKVSTSSTREPFLLTPGPLTTSLETKSAMLKDWGSWDDDFNSITESICEQLLHMISGEKDFVCIPMQGSGTFAIEAALGSFVSRDAKVLVLSNGAYGKRIVTTLNYLQRQLCVLDKGDFLPPLPHEVDEILKKDPDITHVIVVHCETSSGILNPIKDIAKVVKRYGKTFMVDAMSSFGAIPLDAHDIPFDVLISSANKCIEGVPGFGFVLAKKILLLGAKNQSHSYSLDLYDQWQNFVKSRKWRFTPPTHVIAAFHAALQQHATEGGVLARLKRYTSNRDILVKGMRQLGFLTLLADSWLSPIIVTFLSPGDARFVFNQFYQDLKRQGFLIYPGKLTDIESFRIGCIGQIFPDTMEQVLLAIQQSLQSMGVENLSPAVSLDKNIFLHASQPHSQEAFS